MAEKYAGKYRGGSRRLKGWDYSSNGVYYITICERERNCIFGEIVNDKMILNDYGKIVHEQWELSSEIRDEIELDEFIVMPDHLHGIVIINNLDIMGCTIAQPVPQRREPCDSTQLYRRPKSISSFIAGYKSAVTTKINELIINKYGPESNKIYTRKNRLFQVNFNDSIIWNDQDLERIRQYIINNPKNWNK